MIDEENGDGLVGEDHVTPGVHRDCLEGVFNGKSVMESIPSHYFTGKNIRKEINT